VGTVPGEDPGARPEIGFLWERAASLVWAGVPYAAALEAAWKDYCGATLELISEQDRLEMDGIKMTPDGLMGAPNADGWNEYAVASFKLTWRSMKKWHEDTAAVNAGGSGEHFWDWMLAEQAYARAYTQKMRDAGTDRLVARVRFFIFWVMGDYTYQPGHGPQATYCDVFFDTAESERDWKVILRYRDWIKKQEQEASNEVDTVSSVQDQADGHFRSGS